MTVEMKKVLLALMATSASISKHLLINLEDDFGVKDADYAAEINVPGYWSGCPTDGTWSKPTTVEDKMHPHCKMPFLCSDRQNLAIFKCNAKKLITECRCKSSRCFHACH